MNESSQSPQKVGSIFVDSLTLYNESVPRQKPNSFQPKKIIVIDDDTSIHKFVQAVLPKDDFQVYATQNASSGTRASLNFEPDLIILDMQMPGGGGELVHQQVTSLYQSSDIPILIFSALAPDRVRDLIQGHSKTYILQKPVQPNDLRNLVYDLVGESPEKIRSPVNPRK